MSSKISKIKLVFVDDHQSIIEGVSIYLRKEQDLEVYGTASNINDALNLIENGQPDVAIIDLSLQNEHGLHLIQDCKIRFPHVAMIVFSMHTEDVFAERAIKAGAKGYVMKSEPLKKLVEGIRAVQQGKLFVNDMVKDQMIQNKSAFEQDTMALPVSSLSNRELEVFTLIGQGLRPRQIVERLNMSSKTVGTHCRNIRLKMNLDNMDDLIETASKWVQGNEE